MTKPFLIAEIGINHNGDINLAKRMIRESKEAGFDAIKLQKRTINLVYTKEDLDSQRESPWGTTQREQKEGLEFSKDEYDEINHFCNELKIKWSASAWDTDSLKFIENYDPAFHKIASPMLGNKALLRDVASIGKLTYISTGMSTLDELDEVVEIFKSSSCKFELMHCNSTYPMQVEDANLNCIPMLRERYNVNVGYSGHETCLVTVCLVAVALGATSLERHITLDRSMYGSDQSASIETKKLKDFVTAVRAAPNILGDGEKKLLDTEKPAREKLRKEVK
jgi:N-acetylneuraminate synthase